jgi:hypothetical protein
MFEQKKLVFSCFPKNPSVAHGKTLGVTRIEGSNDRSVAGH